MVTALSARDVARLTLALGALLGPLATPTLGPDPAALAEVLCALLGGTAGLIAIARDGGVEWVGEGASDSLCRTLADPRRALRGVLSRSGAERSGWFVAAVAGAASDGARAVTEAAAEPGHLVAGLSAAAGDVAVRFACRLPALRVDDAEGLARMETLLGMAAPAFAAAVLRPQASEAAVVSETPEVRSPGGTHRTIPITLPAPSAAPAVPTPPRGERAVATEEMSLLLAAVLADRYPLTGRETEVAHLLLLGRSNAAVAAALGISESTARHHTERVLVKLGVSSRAEVAWRALHPDEPGRGGKSSEPRERRRSPAVR